MDDGTSRILQLYITKASVYLLAVKRAMDWNSSILLDVGTVTLGKKTYMFYLTKH